VIGSGLSHLLSGERQLVIKSPFLQIAIPARFVRFEEMAKEFSPDIKKPGR
jgi:hypothetical protein